MVRIFIVTNFKDLTSHMPIKCGKCFITDRYNIAHLVANNWSISDILVHNPEKSLSYSWNLKLQPFDKFIFVKKDNIDYGLFYIKIQLKLNLLISDKWQLGAFWKPKNLYFNIIDITKGNTNFNNDTKEFQLKNNQLIEFDNSRHPVLKKSNIMEDVKQIALLLIYFKRILGNDIVNNHISPFVI